MTRRITGAAFQSIDGVVQAPGGPGEDPTGGFSHQGWLASFSDDEVMGETIGALFTPPYGLLLGRRTYDIFAAYWPYVTGEEASFGKELTAAEKYVLTGSDSALEWSNTHRLPDIAAVADLKATEGPDLLIQGSSTLYPQLVGGGLIDRLVLMTFPVTLGEGKRLFDGSEAAQTLRLIKQRISENGVIAAHYEPAGAVECGNLGSDIREPSEREQARRAAIAKDDW